MTKELETIDAKFKTAVVEAEPYNTDYIVNKFKSSEQLSVLENVSLSRYIRRKYGNAGSSKFMESIKKDFTILEVINILKIVGIDRAKDSFEENIKSNPSHLSFTMADLDEQQIDIVNGATYIVENKEYYDNAVKSNPTKEQITSSERKYSNGLKEGVMIKKEPYSTAFTINVYWIDGDFAYDVGTNIAEGGVQKGAKFTFTELPTKEDLVNSIMSYNQLKKEGKKTKIDTDISTFDAHETAKTYWTKDRIIELKKQFLLKSQLKSE